MSKDSQTTPDGTTNGLSTEEYRRRMYGEEPVKAKTTPPMRHCFYCGEEIGRSSYHDPLDNCGKSECVREARYAAQAERDEAHERLDRDMGW